MLTDFLHRDRPQVLLGLIPTGVALSLWFFLGVVNMEHSLFFDYSLGSSSGWHSWFERGEPGEVIRRWGVPIYDSWSGLGYRLPTQGAITDTPLSYLALVSPMNSILLLAWLSSLWYAFHVLHRWVYSWVVHHRGLTCGVVDVVFMGQLSFYALWHGWQFAVVSFAGAAVCLATLTSREITENPRGAPLWPFVSNLSLGMLVMILPSFSAALVIGPMFLILFVFVMFARRAELFRRCLATPKVLVLPLLTCAALAPGFVDLLRERSLQSSLPSYVPEFGLLHYVHLAASSRATPIVSWVDALPYLLYALVFPLMGLIQLVVGRDSFSGGVAEWLFEPRFWPETYAQFSGGLLTLLLALSCLVRAKPLKNLWLARVTAILAIISMAVSILSTPLKPGISVEWLFYSHYLQADIALLLTIVLFVWRADQLFTFLKSMWRLQNVRSLPMKLTLSFGLLVMICTLPFRVIEPAQINSGQTRFSPLQLNAAIRTENEEWKRHVVALQRQLFSTDNPPAMRVLFGEGRPIARLYPPFMGGEGATTWWGLRSHSQLRDIRLSSLLSWPRLRSGETLNPGIQFQHTVAQVSCDETLKDRLDVLAVSWLILPRTCVEKHFSGERRVAVPLPPAWTNLKSGLSPEVIMNEMKMESTSIDHEAVRLGRFHHWWITGVDEESQPCGLLVGVGESTPCMEKLALQRGSEVESAPLQLCERRCIATYNLREDTRDGSYLMIPLNYDAAIQATLGTSRLETVNHHGLLAVGGDGLRPGEITFMIEPDLIMKARGLSPLFFVLLLFLCWRSQKYVQADDASTKVSQHNNDDTGSS